MGRDIAALIAHGARATLLIGLVAAAAATLIGVSIGAAAAWFGGWIDEALMRVTELFQIIPNVVFVLTVVSILGPHIEAITLAVGLVSWPPIARLTRAEFLSFKEREFVQACRAVGMNPLRIVAGEILPNALPPSSSCRRWLWRAPFCMNPSCRSWGWAIPTLQAGAGWSAKAAA